MLFQPDGIADEAGRPGAEMKNIVGAQVDERRVEDQGKSGVLIGGIPPTLLLAKLPASTAVAGTFNGRSGCRTQAAQFFFLSRTGPLSIHTLVASTARPWRTR